MKRLSFKQYQETLQTKKVISTFSSILEKFELKESDLITEEKQAEIFTFLDENFKEAELVEMKSFAENLFEEKDEKESYDKDVTSTDPFTRYRAAIKGTHAHRDLLMHDPDSFVRYGVAQHGNDKHLDALVNDKHALVREQVGQRGNLAHTELLKNDKSLAVRNAAHERSNHLNGKNWLGTPKDIKEDKSMSGLEYSVGDAVRVNNKDSAHHGQFGKIAGQFKVTGPVYNLQFPSGKMAIFDNTNLTAEDGLPQDISNVVDKNDAKKGME